MRAIRFEAFGDPSVLKLVEMAAPVSCIFMARLAQSMRALLSISIKKCSFSIPMNSGLKNLRVRIWSDLAARE